MELLLLVNTACKFLEGSLRGVQMLLFLLLVPEATSALSIKSGEGQHASSSLGTEGLRTVTVTTTTHQKFTEKKTRVVRPGLPLKT